MHNLLPFIQDNSLELITNWLMLWYNVWFYGILDNTVFHLENAPKLLFWLNFFRLFFIYIYYFSGKRTTEQNEIVRLPHLFYTCQIQIFNKTDNVKRACHWGHHTCEYHSQQYNEIVWTLFIYVCICHHYLCLVSVHDHLDFDISVGDR